MSNLRISAVATRRIDRIARKDRRPAQQVLDSALKSGLVLLPLALGSFVMAGPAGVLADKIGGKFILFTGLLCFAGGMGWLAAIATLTCVRLAGRPLVSGCQVLPPSVDLKSPPPVP